MACFHPLLAWQRGEGKPVFSLSSTAGYRPLTLPCGQCIGCRLERSQDWAVRCVHEASLHAFSVFLTLTYNDENCPLSLRYKDFQDFMKRLRQWAARRGKPRLSFFMCGEYGEQLMRPHFHVLVFGLIFEDREALKKLPSGAQLYRSSELEGLWRCGFSSIGDVTYESAAYVARYAAKSALSGHDGKRRDVTQGFVDAETGEFVPFVPEFCRMSLRCGEKGEPGGIGARWFAKYGEEVFPRDRVRIDDKDRGVPRYYDKLLERTSVFALEFQKWIRSQLVNESELTSSRMQAREAVMKAGLRQKVRTL